ncbi:hypothetical protein LPJ53_003571 [Coemansia erecta]|uniref:Eukaryotic translation initiation factor 2A n=1 Tax=Coemansia erecta TaxID=147472 RepID=A0A9W7Y0E3_9FUNG|nr:hypothetical protein LPJ53_003571 [Coemansia erecta]
MSDSEATTQFAFRSSKDMGVWTAPPAAAAAVEMACKPTEEVRAMSYSDDGRLLAWATASEARVVDAQTLQPVATIARRGVVDVQFSPRGSYVVTWERFSSNKADADTADTCNLRVWEALTGRALGGFVQKNFSEGALQWTGDERYCARREGGEVRFYAPTALQRAALTLAVAGLAAFSVSPGLSPSVAVFVPEKGSRPALVRMYSVGSFTQPTASKTFFKADKVEFHWQRLGTCLLVLAQTDVDKTGRSYYGESALYFMAAAGNFDCRVVLDRDGPIHDVAWSPAAKEFVVAYGFMPAKTALFNHRAELVHDFGVAPRNYVRFNPHGRVLAVAGFGNLSGQVDLWDRRTLQRVASIDAHGASACEWSADGRYLMAATLSPRLRVDNGIRIWHYSGALVLHREIAELYQVAWRPAAAERFPQRGALSPPPPGAIAAGARAAAGAGAADSAADGAASSAAAPAAPKPATAYRPPHARLRDAGTEGSAPRSLSAMAESRAFGGAVPGAARPVPGAARAVPGAEPADKKRRNRTRAAKKGGAEPPADAAAAAAAAPAEAQSTPEVDMFKRVRALKKKAGQIDALVQRRDAGEVLEANQLAKIEARAQVDVELAELTAQLAQMTSAE